MTKTKLIFVVVGLFFNITFPLDSKCSVFLHFLVSAIQTPKILINQPISSAKICLSSFSCISNTQSPIKTLEWPAFHIFYSSNLVIYSTAVYPKTLLIIGQSAEELYYRCQSLDKSTELAVTILRNLTECPTHQHSVVFKTIYNGD